MPTPNGIDDFIRISRPGERLGTCIDFSDAVGTRSARADGGTVVLLDENRANGFLLALIVNPQTATVEHYVFQLDQAGNGLVMWGTARAGGAIQKSTLLQARCRAP